MRKFKRIMIILILHFCLFISVSCTAVEKPAKNGDLNISRGQYTVFIINNRIHTGIIIPVNTESLRVVSALKYFENFRYTDIGWGEETAYQDREDIYWHYVKAVLFPNPSVICIEGYNAIGDDFFSWCDFAVMLSLSAGQFIKLISFIENSLKKDQGNEVIITSKRHFNGMIFFKSVHRYHMFNTCNTWIARALQSSGLNISPFFVITAGQLYNEIKNLGTVLKPMK